jgi:hypothetical protein
MQYRRISALLLGAWLGASILTDIAVTQNFQAVDRFLVAPGNSAASAELDAIGRARERAILRRNAGEENNWIFLNFERAEFAIGGALFLALVAGGRTRTSMLVLCGLMLLIVMLQHFLLAPAIAGAGRVIDALPESAPERAQFWKLHGLYSGLEILKILIGIGLSVRLVMRRRSEIESRAPEFAESARGQHG